MANRTRAQIRTFIEYYIGQSTNYATQINALIDNAVESISFLHNFRCLRGMAEATLAQDEYYVSCPVDWKESVRGGCKWLLTSTGEAGTIQYKDETYFHHHFPYPDYSGRSQATPKIYTKIGNYLYFQQQADQSYTIRLWYQKYHQDFTTLAAGGTVDNVSHLFEPDYMALQAIAAWVLSELKTLLPLQDEAIAMGQNREFYVQRLIEADSRHEDEPLELEVYFDAGRDDEFGGGGVITDDPYNWV